MTQQFIFWMLAGFVAYCVIGWLVMLTLLWGIAAQLREANDLRAASNELQRIKNWADST